MTSNAGPFILVGMDGSGAGDQALRWAAQEADRRAVSLMIVNVSDVVGLGHIPASTVAEGMSVFERIDATGRRVLDGAEQRVNQHFPTVRTVTVRKSGAPAAVLAELGADALLTVVWATGLGGFGEFFLGSVAMSLVTDCHCPVAVVRSNRDGQVPASGPVVLGVDAGDSSEAAVAWAFDEAARRGAPLLAVHAWSASLDAYAQMYSTATGIDWEAEAQAEEARFAQRLAGWQEKYPDVSVIRELRAGKPADVVLGDAQNAQLVVVGSRGHGNVTGLMFGSVSRALIHHAPCPVLVARNRH
ncbi:universal stress protein [Tsukamurella serpentis]